MASREDSGTTLWPPKAERSITDDKGGHKHVRKRLWSSILLVAVSAFILLLVVTPTVVFVIRKIDSDVQLRSRCWVRLHIEAVVLIYLINMILLCSASYHAGYQER